MTFLPSAAPTCGLSFPHLVFTDFLFASMLSDCGCVHVGADGIIFPFNALLFPTIADGVPLQMTVQEV